MKRVAAPAPSSCRIAIKAIPGSSRDAAEGWSGDELRVRVRAPALEGRANEAVCELLANLLRLPRRAVSVVRGDTARHKLVRVDGLAADEVRRRLAPPPV